MHLTSAPRPTAVLAFAVAVSGVAAQATTSRASSSSATRAATSASSSFTPLAAKHFTYPGVPYKADTDNGVRGPQYGYNICNSTTEGQSSLCQTAFINSLDDFCLWGPPEPNSVVGNTEGEMVAWCTKPGRGTRLIPEGALKGVQFVKAPAYVQVVGFIDQTKINIQAGDYGGEMDPHGADQRGNPLGGLLFSQAFGSTNGSAANRTWTQAVQWHNFMGADMFCLKACDPAGANDWHYCEHIYDRIGCKYNAPAAYRNGTFESCLSDNQQFPGVYVENGVTRTYTQPAESLGVISTIPYEPVIPASSQCTNYSSAALYTALASVSGGNTTSAATSTRTSTGSLATLSSSTRGIAGAAAGSTSASSSTGAASPRSVASAALVGSALIGAVAAMLL